jgi:hypothetical protein
VCQQNITTGSIITRRQSDDPAKDYHHECFKKKYPDEEVKDVQQPLYHSSAELPVLIHKPCISQKYENLTAEEIQAVREKRLQRFNNMSTMTLVSTNTNQMKAEFNAVTKSTTGVSASDSLDTVDALSKNITEDSFKLQLQQLKLMRFDNESLNRSLLTRHSGDIQQTIDSLLNLNVNDSLGEQLRTLEEMGFNDEVVNRSLLRDCNGDCDRVIELLLSKYQ